MDGLEAQRPPSGRSRDRARGVVTQITNEEHLVNHKMEMAINSIQMLNNTQISLILKKLHEDVLNNYFAAKTPLQCQRYGDYLADIGAANQLKKLIEYLNNKGKYTKEWWDGVNIIRTILCNYSNCSMNMAKEIGKSGILEMLVTEMKSFGPTALKDQKLKILLTYAIDILHNCAKATENRQVLCDIQAAQASAPFLHAEQSEVVMTCLFTIAYIVNESQTYLLQTDMKTIAKLIEVLNARMSDSEIPSENASWSVFEVIKGIAVISRHKKNADSLITLGAIPLLMEVINYYECQSMESECALNALWELSKTDSCRTMMQGYSQLIETLESLSGSSDKYIGAAAKRVLLRITYGSMPGLQRSYCEYQQACTAFLVGLDIPDELFEPKYDKCYCTECHASRNDELYGVQGDPAKQYAIPAGWSRFGLKVAPPAMAHKADTDWHVAYHGTHPYRVKPILKCGQLLIPGDVALGGTKLSEMDGHFNDNCKPEGFNTKQIFVSPSIRYSGMDVYALPNRFEDSLTKKTYEAKVVFQLWIEPDSYKVGQQTVGAENEIDPKFSNQEIEWSTVQRGAIHLYGLLVRLEEKTPCM